MKIVLKRGSAMKIYEKVCNFIKFFLCNFAVSSCISLSFQRFNFTHDVCDRSTTDIQSWRPRKVIWNAFFRNLKWASWYSNERSFAKPIYQSILNLFFQILDGYFDFLVGFYVSNCLWFKTIRNWLHIHKYS